MDAQTVVLSIALLLLGGVAWELIRRGLKPKKKGILGTPDSYERHFETKKDAYDSGFEEGVEHGIDIANEEAGRD